MVTPEISIKDHPQHSSVPPTTATSITTVTGDIIVTLDVHGGIFCLLTERTGFSRSSQSSKINFQGTNISDKPLQVYTDISETGDVRRPIQAVDVRQPNLSSSCSSQVSWNFINLCMPPNWLLLMWYTNLFFEFTRNKCPWWHSFDVTTWAFLCFNVNLIVVIFPWMDLSRSQQKLDALVVETLEASLVPWIFFSIQIIP